MTCVNRRYVKVRQPGETGNSIEIIAMPQLSLTFKKPTTPEEYDAAHPDIWRMFVQFTLQLVRSGVRHYSADGICHKIRFETALRGGKDFKINNNMTSYYARKFLAAYPEHWGFFETRQADCSLPLKERKH